MVAKGGHRLLLSEAEAALRDVLLPMAALLTPNLPEAEVLAGFPVRSEADMRRAAEQLARLGAKAVLMKGGHLEGDRVVDLLFHDGRFDRFEDARIVSRNTHGTGCTLASAIAAGLAQKMTLRDAVARARAYVRAGHRDRTGLRPRPRSAQSRGDGQTGLAPIAAGWPGVHLPASARAMKFQTSRLKASGSSMFTVWPVLANIASPALGSTRLR